MPTRRVRLLACITTILLCAFATAQAQAPAPIPEAMPFDIPYGAPIDLDSAQKAITTAAAEAKKRNWKMAIAVGSLSRMPPSTALSMRRSRSRRRRHAPSRCSGVRASCLPMRSTGIHLPHSACSL
jgi:hypothetical protein